MILFYLVMYHLLYYYSINCIIHDYLIDYFKNDNNYNKSATHRYHPKKHLFNLMHENTVYVFNTIRNYKNPYASSLSLRFFSVCSCCFQFGFALSVKAFHSIIGFKYVLAHFQCAVDVCAIKSVYHRRACASV